MANMWRDLRFGLRLSSRNKGFAFLALVVVALGIGPNTAIFSVFYAALLEPPDWGHAEQVMILWTTTPNGGKALASVSDYLDWKREAISFSDIEAAQRTSFNVAEAEEPELVEGMKESPGMWRFLGQKMLLGRDLLPEDAQLGRDHVALLAHKLWATRFGADPNIVGKTVRMNGVPYTIIRVRGGGQADRDWNQISVPLTIAPELETHRESRPLVVLARLRPDRTIPQAQAEMQAIMSRLAREFPDSNRHLGIKVEPFWNNFLPQETRTNLYLLMGAVSFVLLIACVNVANLLLSRGSVRQKELAVRISLGASKWQLFSQLVTEALLLALVNENFARRFLPGADPIGKRIETEEIGTGFANPAPTVQWEIVGVYHNVQNLWDLDRQNSPEIYLPFWQASIPWGVFAVRTAADPLSMRKAISTAVHSIDPTLPLAKVQTLEQLRDEGLAGDRFTTVRCASFAGLALLLAVAGIYGVMAYTVSERTHEIGLRAALGADSPALLRLILIEGMQLAVAGLAAGLAGAFLVSRLMQSMLFGIGRVDFEAFTTVAVLLLGSALIACYVPARRATRVDPMTALRDQ
jgi:hypothetical protein